MDSKDNKTLYHPSFEHDSCGIGFVANIKGKKSHQIVEDAIIMLQNMEHRGATGSDPKTGDGAGILIQIPHQFFVEECKKIGIDLPAEGKYGVGMLYLPADVKVREACRRSLNIHIEEMGFELLGYRDVPRQKKAIGKTAQEYEPKIEQVFIQPQQNLDPDTLERKLFVLRNYSTHYIGKNIAENRGQFYFSTLSHRTIVYKGQFTTNQVREYYLDLQDERVVSALGLVHSRFSTNTFPKWKLAQPFRFIAHNGEINTIRGNVNWMHSKETLFESSLFTKDEMQKLIPICDSSHSDSANLDAMIEMLVMGGRPLPHVLMMLIPEAWQGNTTMDEKKRAFYQYHASLTEAWDGPASICFTDGNVVGAMLDRNGLRPSRFCITSDDRIIMASEAGALRIDPSLIIKKGRLEPGKIFIADLKQGRVISDEEIKDEICSKQNYKRWLELNSTKLDDLEQPKAQTSELTEEKLLTAQQAYGFTRDDLKFILAPMATETKEPIGSMGADVPLAVLSNHSQHVSNYFKQLFAQVSNPPIDPIRERMVMSLRVYMGKIFNILSETPLHCKQIEIRQPVITNEETDKIRNISHSDFRTFTLDAVFPADGQQGSLEKALDDMCRKADAAILDHGVNILLISDRKIDEKHAPIPSLLSVGALHQHLIKNGLRVRTGFIVEAGDVRETHHFATLIGYGATAVNPYMAFESIKALRKQRLIPQEITEKQAFDNYIGAIGKGLLKIFSKMGISTLQSYQGAQIFEAIGLSQKVIDKCFAGTVSRLGGLDFDGLAKEVLVRHKIAFPKIPVLISRLAEGGIYQWRRRGENHLFNPDTIHLLQQSTRRNDYNLYKQYAQRINDQTKDNFTLRGLLDFKKREPIPVEEVESKEKIFKRFATGAMSFGSLSHEAHSTLAIAMNRIGGKSNSGEGGEDEIRFERKANGDWERSAIKQVASGRFGVTTNYLTNADELQIKMAQGAKPGEGGQLPGHKVDDWIGRVRHSTPGVGLISPPPHHDIYSIEDLAQLIFDLKNANRQARINVKLVSKAGVGTIAAGVSKAHADVILISGHDGGTGASPLSSIHHTGTPWELGLVESHQTLVKNKLRSRVTLQVDGQIRTGRDLAIATLLGAEEWGISTAALVVEGCVMMRKCHLNTCPVGVATQNKELRKLFKGKPDFVINYFSFMAEELREIMASLGFRTIDEMVGKADLLKVKDDIKLWKAKDLNLSPLIHKMPEIDTFYKTVEQDHQIDKVLDWKLLKEAATSIKTGKPISGEFTIYNTNRTVGALLSNEITKKYKGRGLPEGTIHFKFRGSAGQSFGAFNTSGILLELEGEANDYFGKGLSGAQLVVYPDRTSKYKANENVIVGNVAFYGATSGEAYIRGVAGERFCVRNSGAKVVVEGIGAHGCEYMTGGIVVNLGGIGHNFAAGMSGGVVYLYDPERNFKRFLNPSFKDYDTIDYEDDGIIKSLIEKHIKFTQSDVAEKILENWDLEVNNFIKIMPEEYRSALRKMRKTQEERHIA